MDECYECGDTGYHPDGDYCSLCELGEQMREAERSIRAELDNQRQEVHVEHNIDWDSEQAPF